MHSDQPGEERQGFVDVVEKFRYMKIKRTKMDIRKESKINSCLYKSLQTFTVKNNMKKLMALRDNQGWIGYAGTHVPMFVHKLGLIKPRQT